jgi:pantothenate kinase
MQEYGQEMQKEGSGMEKSIKEMMQQMEQTETDLVNKRINIETLRRQQEILSRMLESEKAEQQRELDQKRESEESEDLFYNNPSKFFEYNKIKEKETELFRTIPPSLKPFYKSKVNAYFLSFEK